MKKAGVGLDHSSVTALLGKLGYCLSLVCVYVYKGINDGTGVVLLTFFYLSWSGMALVGNIRQKEERDNHKGIWKEVSKRAL